MTRRNLSATNYDETKPQWPLRSPGDVCGHCASWVWISTDCIMRTNSFYPLFLFFQRERTPYPQIIHISRSQCNSLSRYRNVRKGARKNKEGKTKRKWHSNTSWPPTAPSPIFAGAVCSVDSDAEGVGHARGALREVGPRRPLITPKTIQFQQRKWETSKSAISVRE